MNALAIILARAGSKGVPGKNVRPIAGRACIEWTIDAALAAESVSRVAVSSDDPKAIDAARGMGVEAVTRPAGLAHDTATVDDAARHAVNELGGLDVPIVILYANVPVRPADLIDRAVDRLVATGCDSVQSYERVGKHHPWWMARIDETNGEVSPWQGDVLNHGVFRRQDLPPAYLPDGGVIALTRRALMREIDGAGDGPHAFFGVDRRGIVSPEGSVVDIDTEADVVRAEQVLSERLFTARSRVRSA
ncbi:MAG: acylneuraminate cytidylyltransferase family protein [Planctomycetota bacterium]